MSNINTLATLRAPPNNMANRDEESKSLLNNSNRERNVQSSAFRTSQAQQAPQNTGPKVSNPFFYHSNTTESKCTLTLYLTFLSIECTKWELLPVPSRHALPKIHHLFSSILAQHYPNSNILHWAGPWRNLVKILPSREYFYPGRHGSKGKAKQMWCMI